jgi:head-tail adaptor
MEAGRLDRRLQFQVRVSIDDGHGNEVADWYPQFTVAAGRKYILRGAGEAVMAARLAAHTLATVTVRRSTATQQVTAALARVSTRGVVRCSTSVSSRKSLTIAVISSSFVKRVWLAGSAYGE